MAIKEGQQNFTDFEKAVESSGSPRKGGNHFMILQRNISWVAVGAFAYGFAVDFARRQEWKNYFSPGLLAALIIAAWVVDTNQPRYSRQLRDIAIGIAGSQWLISLLSSLAK